jgi:hypothetical protein
MKLIVAYHNFANAPKMAWEFALKFIVSHVLVGRTTVPCFQIFNHELSTTEQFVD